MVPRNSSGLPKLELEPLFKGRIRRAWETFYRNDVAGNTQFNFLEYYCNLEMNPRKANVMLRER